jgi:hypothetical protein
VGCDRSRVTGPPRIVPGRPGPRAPFENEEAAIEVVRYECKTTMAKTMAKRLQTINAIPATSRKSIFRPRATSSPRQAQKLTTGHDASFDIGGSTTLSVTGNALGAER